MADEPTLQQAIGALYQKAVSQAAVTSTLRLQELAKFCVHQLALRGLEDAETEVAIPGAGRPKQWDVAWRYQGKYRAAVSLKSILRDLSGTVPNRIDDMIGEVANAQMYSPEVVLGYLMVFDTSQDAVSPKHGTTWCELLKQRLSLLSGRKAPAWSFGTIESFAVIEVDFSHGALIKTPESTVLDMLDRLVAEVKHRNPSLTEAGNP